MFALSKGNLEKLSLFWTHSHPYDFWFKGRFKYSEGRKSSLLAESGQVFLQQENNFVKNKFWFKVFYLEIESSDLKYFMKIVSHIDLHGP